MSARAQGHTSTDSPSNPAALLNLLQEYLRLPGEPNARLNPRWLAKRLDVDERDLLNALAYAVRDGLVELHWEVYCPICGRKPEEFERNRYFASRRVLRGSCVDCLPRFTLTGLLERKQAEPSTRCEGAELESE